MIKRIGKFGVHYEKPSNPEKFELEPIMSGQEHVRVVEEDPRITLPNKAAPNPAAEVPFPELRRPNRRKTSDVVTRMEMTIRTMIIHV